MTPRPYLSWSQISALEWSEANYIKSYIWGVRQSSPQLELGARLHSAAQFRKKSEEKWIKDIIRQIPDFPLKEYKVEAKAGDVPLMGILDGWSVKELELSEIKTGAKPSLKGWADQLTMYSLLLYQADKKIPKKISVYFAQTYFNDDGQLLFRGNVEKFDIKITLKDVIKFVPRIASTWKRIKLLVENERKIWGELPF